MNQVTILPTPIKSEGDPKEYRLIRLSNGLKAFLISKTEEGGNNSDDNEILAAANLIVGIGSFDEPSNIGGLAHFLEHMLFMGSKKYPEESSYHFFIASNGGNDNAMTENEFTSYFFEVSESAFPEALDRFSQQFAAPLLLKEALQREREAVDSEYQMAVARDSVRIASFFKNLINEQHPASYFDYGNLKSLKEDITDEALYEGVHDIFKRYVSNNMFLAIQSKRTLDELQEIVVNNFAALRSGELPNRSLMPVDEIFKPEFYNKIFYIKPKKETNSMYLTFYLDSVDPHYKCRPLKYIKNIFKNDGEGGLSNYLKERSLAISAGLSIDTQAFDSNSMFALVKIHVSLTSFGLENLEKVLEAIFSYLLMMKETPIEEHRRLYNDYKEKSEIEFKFHKEPEPSDNVEKGAIGLKYFQDADVIRGHLIFQDFDEVIPKIINVMNTRKFNIIIVTLKHEKFDKKAKYFGTEYDELDFPENYQKLWDERKPNPEFFLEKPNPFKATNFEIFENDDESPQYPVKFIDNEKVEAWHKLDNKFKTPHAEVRVHIISPKHLKNAFKLAYFAMTKKIFAATSAGLVVSANASLTGFELEFGGYNEKLHLLIDMVTKDLNIVDDIDESVFEVIRAEMKKNYGNQLMSASNLRIDFSTKILSNNYYTDLEYYEIIDTITLEHVQKFVSKFFKEFKMHVLVQGNMTRSQAARIVENLEENLGGNPLDGEYELQPRGYQLPLGTSTLRLSSLMPNDDNTFNTNFYQYGPDTLNTVNCLRLLESILDPRAFENLRTKEQLGYSVEFAFEGGNTHIFGLCLKVSSQEHKHPYSTVQSKMDFFTSNVAKKAIEELTDEDFEGFKDARIKMLSSEDLDLESEVIRNWGEIKIHRFMFNRVELAAKLTKNLTKINLIECFKSFTEPQNMRKLCIQVIGNQTSDESPEENSKDLDFTVRFKDEKLSENENVITDIEEFKKNLFLHPVVEFKIQ